MQAMAPSSSGDLQAGHSFGVPVAAGAGAGIGTAGRDGGVGRVGATAGAGDGPGAPAAAPTGCRAAAAAPTTKIVLQPGHLTCLPLDPSGTCIFWLHLGQLM